MLSDGLYIKSGGICERVIWDTEKRSQYEVKKNNNSFDIINSEGKVVANVATRAEADQYFYTKVKVESFLQELKAQCYIEDKIKLSDIFDLIHYNEELEFIVESIFPFYAEIPETYKKPKNEEIIVGRYGKINSDRSFEVCVLKNLPASQNFESYPITFNNSFHISKSNSTIFTCNDNHYTLLEILYCLFGDYHDFPDVTITKNGILLDHSRQLVNDNHIQYLFSNCKIESDVTLHDIMNLVDNDKILKEFIKFYSTCYYIDEYYKESLKPFVANKEDDYTCDQDFLEVYPYIVASLDKKKSYFNMHFGFHGIKGEEHYSNSMTPINAYSFLPIKLKTDAEISFRDKKLNVISKEKVEINYKLIDILDSIYDDISFHGSPEDRDETLNGLKETVEQIKEGELKTYPMEDLLKELDLDLDDDDDDDD